MTDPTKNDSFWFNDGDFVLNVQDTQFRIHLGVLASHCRAIAFRAEMFGIKLTLPNTASDEAKSSQDLKDCMVAHLKDDDPKDWVNVLNIMYNSDMSYVSMEEFPLPLLTSALRLSLKYNFEKIYDAAIERLRVAIPETLDKWDDFVLRPRFPSPPLYPSGAAEGMDLLNLLLEVDLREFLPRAYLMGLHLISLEDILGGALRDDYTIASLSIKTARTLILGKDAILNSKAFRAFRKVEIPSPQCNSRIACKLEADQWALELPYPYAEDALEPWTSPSIDKFCEECRKQLVDLRLPHRQKIWANLPRYFGLDFGRNYDSDSDTPESSSEKEESEDEHNDDYDVV